MDLFIKIVQSPDTKKDGRDGYRETYNMKILNVNTIEDIKYKIFEKFHTKTMKSQVNVWSQKLFFDDCELELSERKLRDYCVTDESEIICMTTEYDNARTVTEDLMDIKVVYVADGKQHHIEFTHGDPDTSDAIDPKCYIELIKHEVK